MLADSEDKYHFFNSMAGQDKAGVGANTGGTSDNLIPTSMTKEIDLIADKVPVLCKVNIPVKKCKSRHDHNEYEIRFKFKDLTIEEDNYRGKPSRLGAVRGSSNDRSQLELRAAVSLPKEGASNSFRDLTVFVSATCKEPNQKNHDLKVVNQSQFLFKCAGPPDGYVYFTLISEKGRRVRISLEYLGHFKIQQEKALQKEKLILV